MAGILACEMLFSCSSALEDSSAVSSDCKGFSIVIDNYNSTTQKSASSNSSRLIIAPDTCEISGVSKFILEGLDSLNPLNQISQVIAIDGSGVGTIESVAPSFWHFTLHAYSDEECTTEILRGSASVDTRQAASVSFTLSSSGLTTPGSYDLTLKYTDTGATAFDEMVGEIHVVICDAVTLETVQEIAVVSTAANLTKFTDGTGYIITDNEIAPGAYILTAHFYQIANSKATKIGFFSAGFIVEPGRNTTQTVTIPHIIAVKPEAPENLKAYRDDSTLNADSYNAVIRWDDVPNNEEYFQLVIREFDSASATTGVRTVLDYSNYASKSFAADGIGYVGGSLVYNSEEIVLKLATGKLYDFELYAINTYGNSVACVRSASGNIDSDPTYGAMTGFDAPGDSAPYKRVNTFTISYSLENGRLITERGTAYSGQNFIEYKVYKGSDTALMIPATIVDPSDSTYSSQTEWPVCYYGNLSQGWEKWVASGSDTAVTSVSTFTNRTFYAVYDIQTASSVYFDNDAVHVTYGSTAADSVYGSGNDVVLSSGDSVTTGYVTITIDRGSEPSSVFPRFDFYVNGIAQSTYTGGAGTSSISYTIPLFLKGSFTLQVSGTYNEQYFYSDEFVIKVN